MLIVPYKIEKEKGGAHQFVDALLKELKNLGIESRECLTPDGSRDVVFANAFLAPVEVIRRFYSAGHPVLLRLDGSANAYGRFDNADCRQCMIARYADLIVYQSTFCKNILSKFKITDKGGSIIPNGVDTEFFSPEGEKSSWVDSERPKILFAAHSQLVLKGLRHYINIAVNCPDFDFYLAGRKGEDCLDVGHGGNLPDNIKYLGKLNHKQLADTMRSVDIFCTPAVNDPAPNVVLQALSCGLPVLHSGSGGVPEEVGECGRQISGKPEEDINRLLEKREELSKKARERILKNNTIKIIAEKYKNVINRLEGQKEVIFNCRHFVLDIGKRFFPTKVLYPKIRAGFFLNLGRVSSPSRYHKIKASAWIRCFQLIRPLGKMGVEVVVDPENFDNLDIAVLMDRPDKRQEELSLKLKEKNIPYIIDLIINTLEIYSIDSGGLSLTVDSEYVERTERIIKGAAGVSAVSPWLADTVAKYHTLSKFIPDTVPDKWYGIKTTVNKNSPLTLLYCGKSKKADMLYDWWEVAKNKGCRLLFFSDSAENMPDGAEFIQWKYSAVKNVFQKADVGLAPREGLDNPYNFSHSSFKVESIMLAGIPVVASPVRSYLNILGDNECGGIVNTVDEFEALLDRFIVDREYLESASQAAVKKAAPHMQRRGAEIWNRFIRSVLLINNSYI